MDLAALIQECAPEVGSRTIAAIIRTESKGNPLAIGVNGGQLLARQPHNAGEAAQWARWLVERGYSVDLGLMQINSANIGYLGLTLERAFDACANIRAGSLLLREYYQRARQQHGESDLALYAALSAYNTGSLTKGFANGYVSKVAGRPVRLTAATLTASSGSPRAVPASTRGASSAPVDARSGETRRAWEAGTAIEVPARFAPVSTGS